jgi:hypothetical protein
VADWWIVGYVLANSSRFDMGSLASEGWSYETLLKQAMWPTACVAY